jgi:hypothetical protein
MNCLIQTIQAAIDTLIADFDSQRPDASVNPLSPSIYFLSINSLPLERRYDHPIPMRNIPEQLYKSRGDFLESSRSGRIYSRVHP